MAAPFGLNRTALLSMDCQAGLIAAAVKDKSFTERGASLVAAARRGRMMIIHIQVGFRSRASGGEQQKSVDGSD